MTALPRRDTLAADSLRFLAAIGPNHLIRALWPSKGPLSAGAAPIRDSAGTPLPALTVFYGAPTPVRMAECQRLNDLGYGIYFTANDPHGTRSKLQDFQDCRAIWQDADNPETSQNPQLIDGREPTAVWETSPGRFQRIWRTEPFPRLWEAAVHARMVAWHEHDNGAGTVSRLLRVPGFRNTKHDGAPLSVLHALNETAPPIPVDVVRRYFSCGDTVDILPPEPRPGQGVVLKGGAARGMDRIQRSGDRKTATIYDFDQARPGRAGRDTETGIARERAAAGQPVASVGTTDLLRVLSQIDPDSGYSDWRKVGAALHYMSRNGELFDGAGLFERWSMLGSKYTAMGQYAPSSQWATFDLEHERPATFITLKHMRAGASPGASLRFESELFKQFQAANKPELEIQAFTMAWPETQDTHGIPVADTTSIRNARAALASLSMVPVYDSFGQTVRFGEAREPITDEAVLRVWRFMHEQRCRMDVTLLRRFIAADAYAEMRNPLAEWFDTLPAWDGVERLPTLFQRHLGTPDLPYIRELGPLLFVAVLKRAYQPGFKFDLMPILEGAQGKGKSSLFRHVLPFQEWYSEAPRLDMEEKRLYPMLAGKVFVEFAEMRGKRTTEVEHIKALVSQTTDEYIPNYAVEKVSARRTAIFIGTTNSRRYLRDLSGNRRFPIVEVTKELEISALAKERLQLWAEARFLSDFTDVLRFSSAAEAGMEETQEARLDVEATVEDIVDAVKHIGYGFLTMSAIWDAMGLPFEKRAQRATSGTKHQILQIKELLLRDGWLETDNPVIVSGRKQRGMYKTHMGTSPEIVFLNGNLQHLHKGAKI